MAEMAECKEYLAQQGFVPDERELEEDRLFWENSKKSHEEFEADTKRMNETMARTRALLARL